ncbi:unnamed protein product [Closterium sp. NIES-53]
MAPSPLAMAPRDLPPLTAALMPCCNMVGEGVARGGSSCLCALQLHAQLRPRSPPPPPWGWRGEGERGWRMCLSSSSCHHASSSLSPCRTLWWERGGSLEVQGEAGGDLQHRPPPAPLILLLPPPAAGAAVGGKRSAIPLLRMRQWETEEEVEQGRRRRRWSRGDRTHPSPPYPNTG